MAFTPFLRYDCSDFDLYFRLVFDQRAHLDRGHRGIVLADQLAVGGAELAAGGEILALVGDIPGHARDVLGPGARLGEHGDYILQRLPRLAGEIARLEFALLVPADLAGDEHLAAAGRDAVGIAARRGPACGVQDLHKGFREEGAVSQLWRSRAEVARMLPGCLQHSRAAL